MNCKPGDLAVVVKAILPTDFLYLGTFLTVTRICNSPNHLHGEPSNNAVYWKYKKASRPLFCSDDAPAECVRDECLKPIRPPNLELPAPPVLEELIV